VEEIPEAAGSLDDRVDVLGQHVAPLHRGGERLAEMGQVAGTRAVALFQ
jgi:hypothetical protein